jgi:DNA polymerase elongation subunit (family B)
VSEYFDKSPETLFAYALDDARETRSLSAMLAPSYFVQAQMLPYTFQNAILRGNATKIDSMLIRAYIRDRHSIPSPRAVEAVAGGYTEMRRCGVGRGVLHCDVTSLYPSLMLEFGHGPGCDPLGVFLRMLGNLRSFRVKAKAAARASEGAERQNLEAIQQTFKIFINSFYGYLGFGLGHFNDFAQAGEVTRRGRELIQRALADLEGLGAEVIEVDTDGIYFVPPPGADPDAILEKLGAALPPSIRLELDGRYAAMFSYKMKNYVLLGEDGRMTIRGSGLRSRGLERFQRRFMAELFALMLAGRHAEADALFSDYSNRIAEHRIGIDDLMKTETLQDSLEAYSQKRSGKRRNLSAAYELALKGNRPYQSGDQISYYVTGRGKRVKVAEAARMAAEYDRAHPDENVEYYQAKLADLYEKFRPYVITPGLFPAAAAEEEPAQGSLLSDTSE